MFAVAVIRQELPWFDARSDHLVQQVAEFLEAVAERALLLDGTIRVRPSRTRGLLEDRVFDDRHQEFSGAYLDEQGAALLLEGSSVRSEFLEPRDTCSGDGPL